MTNAIATQNGNAPIDISVVEKVITGGDLGQLTAEQRVRYYIETCDSLKLNWKTKPFDVVSLRGSGPKILYPNKGCAEQLAGIHNVSVDLLEAYTEQGVRIQKAKACLANGRCVTKTGAVTVDGLRGDNYANAVMKCETKAHRRAVLALVGLNMPDESELETIPGSQRFTMDVNSGEMAPQPARPAQAQHSTHSPTPVHAEVVDARTGEIQSSEGMGLETAKAETARLAKALNLSTKDVTAYARTIGANYRTVEGANALRDALEEMLEAQQDALVEARETQDDDEEDYEAYEAAQGTLIDAETKPIYRWG